MRQCKECAAIYSEFQDGAHNGCIRCGCRLWYELPSICETEIGDVVMEEPDISDEAKRGQIALGKMLMSKPGVDVSPEEEVPVEFGNWAEGKFAEGMTLVVSDIKFRVVKVKKLRKELHLQVVEANS